MTVRHKRSKRNKKRARKAAAAARIRWDLRLHPFREFDMEEGLIWVKLHRKSGSYLDSRIPEETFREYPMGKAFRAAGKMYTDEQELRAWGEETDADADFAGYHDRIGTFLDRYGRKVACLAEKIPGYDDCDRKYDNRFYRCYYICDNNKLTGICFVDGGRYVSVREDMESILYARWETLKALNWILPE